MKMEPRNLSAAYKFYCKKELEGAHGAEADTRATYEILKSQLDTYSNLTAVNCQIERTSEDKKWTELHRVYFYVVPDNKIIVLKE